MSNKGYMDDKVNPLDDGGDNTPPSLTEIDAIVYGGIAGMGVTIPRIDKRVAMPILLEDIRRDPTQPRRVVPMRVLSDWRGEPDGVDEVIHRWHKMAQSMPLHIDVKAWLDKRAWLSEDTEPKVTGLVRDFLAVLSLAGDIKRDGLINPITVVKAGNLYRIETGERRWWAYQVLRIFDDADKWQAIPAYTTQSATSIWRTAGENAQREELNAIAKARQFALLVMDINRGRDGVKYYDYDFFSHDREFYAQVGNGTHHPVPENKVKAVCDAIGVNGGKARLSQIRRLLRDLNNDQWDKFDEDNTPESVIRNILAPEPTTPPPVERLTTVNLSQNTGAFTPVKHPAIDGDNGHSTKPKFEYTPPSPAPTPRPVYTPPMVDEDDDVLMDDDGDNPPMINRPFAYDANYRPSDAPIHIPKDPRYVQAGSLLNHFLAMLVAHADMYRYALAQEVVTLRDLTPDNLRGAVRGLDAGEREAWLVNLSTAVMVSLKKVEDEMVNALNEAWADVSDGSDD